MPTHSAINFSEIRARERKITPGRPWCMVVTILEAKGQSTFPPLFWRQSGAAIQEHPGCVTYWPRKESKRL